MTRLTKEVDVYCDWIDEANELAKQKKSGKHLGYSENVEERDGDDDSDEELLRSRPTIN